MNLSGLEPGSERLQNIDIFTCQSFIHAADSTEFTTHAAGVAVVIFRLAAVADGFCSFRIKCAGILFIPVQIAAGIGHTVVNIPGAGDSFGNISCMSCDFGGKDSLVGILYLWRRKMFGWC